MPNLDLASNIARVTLAQALSGEIADIVFTTDKKATSVPPTAEGNLTLIGYALGDAHTANDANYLSLFENPTHPAITQLAKRRSTAGEMNATTPKAVATDLNIKPAFGKPTSL